MRCSGSESRLIDCDHPPVGDENCDHFEDAGVRCGKSLVFFFTQLSASLICRKTILLFMLKLFNSNPKCLTIIIVCNFDEDFGKYSRLKLKTFSY